jgi:hypothetical protein
LLGSSASSYFFTIAIWNRSIFVWFLELFQRMQPVHQQNVETRNSETSKKCSCTN